MNVHSLSIYPVNQSMAVSVHDLTERKGRVSMYSAILADDGANVNTGFYSDLLYNFTNEACARMGMATLGAYVQNGTSPKLPELIDYLKTL